MIDCGADKPKVRNQIAFIAREVAVVEADYARLAEGYSKLHEAHSVLEAQKTALNDGKRKAGWDALQKQAR